MVWDLQLAICEEPGALLGSVILIDPEALGPRVDPRSLLDGVRRPMSVQSIDAHMASSDGSGQHGFTRDRQAYVARRQQLTVLTHAVAVLLLHEGGLHHGDDRRPPGVAPTVDMPRFGRLLGRMRCESCDCDLGCALAQPLPRAVRTALQGRSREATMALTALRRIFGCSRELVTNEGPVAQSECRGCGAGRTACEFSATTAEAHNLNNEGLLLCLAEMYGIHQWAYRRRLQEEAHAELAGCAKYGLVPCRASPDCRGRLSRLIPVLQEMRAMAARTNRTADSALDQLRWQAVLRVWYGPRLA